MENILFFIGVLLAFIVGLTWRDPCDKRPHVDHPRRNWHVIVHGQTNSTILDRTLEEATEFVKETFCCADYYIHSVHEEGGDSFSVIVVSK